MLNVIQSLKACHFQLIMINVTQPTMADITQLALLSLSKLACQTDNTCGKLLVNYAPACLCGSRGRIDHVVTVPSLGRGCRLM